MIRNRRRGIVLAAAMLAFMAIVTVGAGSSLANASQQTATSVRPAADQNAQQLVYYDDQCGNNCTYSIKIFGYNQDHFYQNGVCFNTPNHTTVTWNWWWAPWNGTVPQVYTYHNSGCPAGQAFLHLNFIPDGRTPYRCLSDLPPNYPDWSCPNP